MVYVNDYVDSIYINVCRIAVYFLWKINPARYFPNTAVVCFLQRINHCLMRPCGGGQAMAMKVLYVNTLIYINYEIMKLCLLNQFPI